eukprot:gene23030-biopygen8389
MDKRPYFAWRESSKYSLFAGTAEHTGRDGRGRGRSGVGAVGLKVLLQGDVGSSGAVDDGRDQVLGLGVVLGEQRDQLSSGVHEFLGLLVVDGGCAYSVHIEGTSPGVGATLQQCNFNEGDHEDEITKKNSSRFLRALVPLLPPNPCDEDHNSCSKHLKVTGQDATTRHLGGSHHVSQLPGAPGAAYHVDAVDGDGVGGGVLRKLLLDMELGLLLGAGINVELDGLLTIVRRGLGGEGVDEGGSSVDSGISGVVLVVRDDDVVQGEGDRPVNDSAATSGAAYPVLAESLDPLGDEGTLSISLLVGEERSGGHGAFDLGTVE